MEGSSQPARRAAAGWRDCLKMRSALMKRTELNFLKKLVQSGEQRKLSAADLALLLRIRFALQEYEASRSTLRCPTINIAS